MIRTARIAVLVALGSALHVRAQTPVPQATFRGGTDLVQVDVSVLDGKRHPVRGLTAADFSIFEDGQPREIQAFSEVSLPDRVQSRDASWTREVASDVATNVTAGQEGRVVIILLDRTIPLGEPTITARRIAAATINQLAWRVRHWRSRGRHRRRMRHGASMRFRVLICRPGNTRSALLLRARRAPQASSPT